MEYQYPTQLGPADIRLLKVVPRRAPVDLHFQVIDVPRKSCPKYTAVSYTWGDEQADHIIFLDGATFKVRANLWHCLHNLARFVSGTNSMISQHCIWVDAICIDQSNVQERNYQVRKMDETYRNASIVSVWLGLKPGAPPTAWLKQPNETLLKILDDMDLDWSENETNLANRPYWSRFWVIQEMLLAPHVYFFCGNEAKEITDFKNLLCDTAGIPMASDDLQQDQIHQFPALPLIIGRSPDRYPELYDPLHTLLIRHSQADCKDPRDRVFALLGLVSRDDHRLLARVFPDYSLSEDEVLIFTLAHLTQTPWNELKSKDLSEDIRLDKHKVFSALKIASYMKRLSLLQRANRIDWLHLEPVEDARYDLELSARPHDAAMPHSVSLRDPLYPMSRETRALMISLNEDAAAMLREAQRDYGTLERNDWDASRRERRNGRTKIYVWTIIVLISTLTGLYCCSLKSHTTRVQCTCIST
ncbi:hypothetical protein CC79DRAFT_1192865 [Sarocladium strictum]